MISPMGHRERIGSTDRRQLYLSIAFTLQATDRGLFEDSMSHISRPKKGQQGGNGEIAIGRLRSSPTSTDINGCKTQQAKRAHPPVIVEVHARAQATQNRDVRQITDGERA